MGYKIHQKASLLAELNKKAHSWASEPVHFRTLSRASFHKGDIVFVRTQQFEGGENWSLQSVDFRPSPGTQRVLGFPRSSVQTSPR